MKFDLVDAVAEPVVGAQDGGFSLASRPHSWAVGGPGEPAHLPDLPPRPSAALAAQRVEHGRVVGHS